MKIQAYSFANSFGDNSRGKDTNTLQDADGKTLLPPSMWAIGYQAFSVLKSRLEDLNSTVISPAEIEESIPQLEAQMNDFLCQDFYPIFKQKVEEGRLELQPPSKERLFAAWEEYSVVDRFAMFLNFVEASPFGDWKDFVPQHAALAILIRIDDCAIATFCDDIDGLLLLSMDIQRMRSHLAESKTKQAALNIAVKVAMSEKAKLGGIAKLSNDPKQKDKTFVHECWTDWQAQPARYNGNAAFARDMLQKYENLTSQPVIERWCRHWKEESDTQPAK